MNQEYARFKKMVEHSQDWFWEFDEQANFTYVSPRIKDLLGYEPEELLGLNAFDLMTPEEAERVRGHFDPIAKKYLPFNQLINVNLHKDGHEVIIESCGTPIFDEQGRFRGYQGIDRDITQRKRGEEDLRQSREKFQNILDTSSEWIWEVDLSGRHTYSNHRLFELLGYRLEEFVGQDFFRFLHEEDRQEVQAALPRLIAEKRGWNSWVLRWRHRDGSYRYLESNAKPMLDVSGEIVGYNGADRDVTERKATEDALRASEALLAQTQELAKVGSWQLEVASSRLTWSDETYRIFGLDPQSFAATYEAFLAAVHPDDRAAVAAAYSASLQAGQDTYEISHRVIQENSGDVRYVYEKCRHERDTQGAVVRSIGMVKDITERKANEEALLSATQAAEAANRAKGLFLANVSHEIRTPMTAVIGFGELLEETELTSDQRQYLEAINTASNALAVLIDDVLDLSKVEAGELAITQKDFGLRKFMAEVVGLQEPQIARKNLAFNLSIDADVPDSLAGDPVRIQQVLLNLLGNAIKFTDKGTISVTVSLAEESGARVLLDIAVTDTGAGIPADFLTRIFAPFAQISSTSSHNRGGAGLGLAISQSLAKLMGGTIRVQSQMGTGSTFHLLIPLLKKAGPQIEKKCSEAEPVLWRGSALRILLAEDNPINIQFIKTILEQKGHVVTTAENGKVALAVLQSGRFDLVLMDIHMPVMSGVEALLALRDLERQSQEHLTVIALTAYALIGDKEKYLKLGFDGYLSKPFAIRELAEELTRVAPERPLPSKSGEN